MRPLSGSAGSPLSATRPTRYLPAPVLHRCTPSLCLPVAYGISQQAL
ncbi:MAG: hypothetical protein J6B36_00380 [Muribaculaceae bacterium]|nr:hypothetical protein [Muribaculaceae bacterium]